MVCVCVCVSVSVCVCWEPLIVVIFPITLIVLS